jgi:histidyl-tRNA synthetase
LRYDLTVPFARYVVQHQNDIEFPLKDIKSNLCGADRPQKGRFREFFNVMLMCIQIVVARSRISTII